MASVYKPKYRDKKTGETKESRIWWIKIQRCGETIRESARTKSKAVAGQYLRRREDELDALIRGDKPQIGYDEAMLRFMNEYIDPFQGYLKPKSAARYLCSIDSLNLRLEGKGLAEIVRDIRTIWADFVSKRKHEGVSNASINRDRACLSKLLSQCVLWDYIEHNPLIGGPIKPLKEAQPRKRYLTIEEERGILQHAGDKEAKTEELPLMILFAIETGLRSEEQFSLLKKDVDMHARQINIRDAVAKSGKGRVVPISDRLWAKLRAKSIHHTSPYLFAREDGKRYRHVLKGFRGACKRAKVKDWATIKWHDLRRTFGCRFLQRLPKEYKILQDLLGHHSVTVTEKSYAFLEVGHLHAAMRPENKQAKKRSKSVRRDVLGNLVERRVSK